MFPLLPTEQKKGQKFQDTSAAILSQILAMATRKQTCSTDLTPIHLPAQS